MMSKFHVHLIITALSLLVFLPGLGWIELFDWDELNFAESAREMVVSHNYQYVQIKITPFGMVILDLTVTIDLRGNHFFVVVLIGPFHTINLRI